MFVQAKLKFFINCKVSYLAGDSFKFDTFWVIFGVMRRAQSLETGLKICESLLSVETRAQRRKKKKNIFYVRCKRMFGKALAVARKCR